MSMKCKCGTETVTNHAGGNQFYYCRACKIEVHPAELLKQLYSDANIPKELTYKEVSAIPPLFSGSCYQCHGIGRIHKYFSGKLQTIPCKCVHPSIRMDAIIGLLEAMKISQEEACKILGFS